jgi:hypothetical protein
MYALTLPFQLLTTGAVLEQVRISGRVFFFGPGTDTLVRQGTTALVVLTAIHAGLVAALFWALIANALVATQVVEDGTPSSLVVRASLCPARVLLTSTACSHSGL